MYKLMLVDDEDTVRHQVINKIDWQSYGFEIVCEAENGSEAFDLFEVHQPDVVITDIKMPFMDGLELSGKILEKYPFTKIVILTGFDEFEYAQKGIDLHITNYILKPVSSKELIRILEEVKTMIDSEIEHKRDVDRLQRHYERSYDLMRSRFLESLVSPSEQIEELEEWLKYYDIHLKGNYHMASVIQIDRVYNEKHNTSLMDLEYEKIALLDVLEEVDEQFGLGEYFLSGNEVVILSSEQSGSEEQFVTSQMDKMEKVRQAAEKFLTHTVTIGCGRAIKHFRNLHRSKNSASSACDYKLTLGTNQIYYINDLEKTVGEELDFGEQDNRTLKRIIKSGDVAVFNAFIENAFSDLPQTEIHHQLLIILEIFNTIAATGKEMGIPNAAMPITYKVLYEILGQNEPLSYKKESVIRLGKTIIEMAVSSRESSNSSLVKDTKAYVEANYKDWELNIEKISAHLHYSPNYFSSMFKKENGDSFMNYLSAIRIDKAKELLVTTDMKNFEIAMDVGFSSANYFSYCFKKEVERSPTVYRKTYKN